MLGNIDKEAFSVTEDAHRSEVIKNRPNKYWVGFYVLVVPVNE